MGNDNSRGRPPFIMRHWGKVEQSVGYKITFILLVGCFGALYSLFLALLLLYKIEAKWTFYFVAFGFGVALLLSPIQYYIYHKRYRKHLTDEQHVIHAELAHEDK